MNVTREKLYEEIWAEPITKVSKRYGVSDSFLVRVLQRMNVPRPPRGYWARLAVGKIMAQPVLPEAHPEDELEWSRNGQPLRVRRAPPKPPVSSQPTRVRKKVDRPASHPLVVGARTHFENVRETDAGYLKPNKKLLVDLIVSKEILDHALDIANELFLLLEDRGHRVVLAPRDGNFRRAALEEREVSRSINHYPGLWQPYAPTVVFIGTVAIGLTLFEASELAEAEWVNGKYVRASDLPLPRRKSWVYLNSSTPKHDFVSGRLCLQAYSPYHDTEWELQWRESKAVSLHSKLKTITRALSEAASVISIQVEAAEHRAAIRRKEWELQQEKWRLEEAERKRLQAIKESREELYRIIEVWNEAKRIEGFLSEAEQRTSGLSEEDRLEVLDRLKAAREQLGEVDALKHFIKWKTVAELLEQ